MIVPVIELTSNRAEKLSIVGRFGCVRVGHV